MSITFNTWINVVKIWIYDNGSGLYTQVTNTAPFDYFTDDCEAGDFLLFAISTISHPRNLLFNIGTAFAANSVTFAWEYLKEIGVWEALSNVVDGTNDLSNLGQNNVTFDMPDRWDRVNIIGGPGNYIWMRLRVASVDTPTEGGAQQTDPLKAGNNTLNISGEGTEEAPITWDDVYDEDQAQGWGVVLKPTNGCYVLDHISLLANNTTYMESENEIVEWKCSDETSVYRFSEQIQFYGYYRMGKLNDYGGAFQEPCNGSILILNGGYRAYWPYSNGKMYMYASSISSGLGGIDMRPYWFPQGTLVMDRINMNNIDFNPYPSNEWTMNDVYMVTDSFTSNFIPYVSPTSITGLVAKNLSNAPYLYLDNAPDIQLINCDFTKCNRILVYRRDVDSYIINHVENFDVKPITIAFGQNSIARAGILYEQYTFDLQVTKESGDPIEDATIYIVDNQGVEYNLTTDANGDIVQQTLTRKHYKGKEDASDDYDTFNHNPHYMKISKAGYQIDEQSFCIKEKTTNLITLKHSRISVDQEVY